MSRENGNNSDYKSLLAFECKKQWNELEINPDRDEVRFCTECKKDVYLTSSDAELLNHAKLGNCVSLPGNRIRIVVEKEKLDERVKMMEEATLISRTLGRLDYDEIIREERRKSGIARRKTFKKFFVIFGIVAIILVALINFLT